MKVLVDRLTATPSPFQFERGSAWWRAATPDLPGLPREVSEPFRVRLNAHRIGDDLFLDGEVEGAFELECSRCLARYRSPLRESFRLVLEPAGQRVPAEPEGAAALARDGVCLGDELETGWYRGTEIDLGAFLLELISLSLPVKPLCREDCAGLCPHCGEDLNRSPCGCKEIKPESPFAALAALRDRSTEGVS